MNPIVYILLVISNLGDIISSEAFPSLNDALYARHQARSGDDVYSADVVSLGVEVTICLNCNRPEIIMARNNLRFNNVSLEIECFDCYEARKAS